MWCAQLYDYYTAPCSMDVWIYYIQTLSFTLAKTFDFERRVRVNRFKLQNKSRISVAILKCIVCVLYVFERGTC